MLPKKLVCFIFASGAALGSGVPAGNAAEYAFTAYPLGSLSFGAGFTPPPGYYFTDAVSFYPGAIGGTFYFGGRTFNAGVKADLFADTLNILLVPGSKPLDGRFGVSVSVPAASVNYDARASGPLTSIAAQTSGAGAGDTIL